MGTVLIPLTQGKIATIDERDAERVLRHKWHALRNDAAGRVWYAATTTKTKRQLYLHRFILNPPPNVFIDHANGNGLDCRRENMRECTRSQNAANQGLSSRSTSGYRGVTWHGQRSAWRARINVQGLTHFLGCFADAEDAARAYDAAAREHFGEFARLNFPNG